VTGWGRSMAFLMAWFPLGKSSTCLRTLDDGCLMNDDRFLYCYVCEGMAARKDSGHHHTTGIFFAHVGMICLANINGIIAVGGLL
jgi:hypothetical protein